MKKLMSVKNYKSFLEETLKLDKETKSLPPKEKKEAYRKKGFVIKLLRSSLRGDFNLNNPKKPRVQITSTISNTKKGGRKAYWAEKEY